MCVGEGRQGGGGGGWIHGGRDTAVAIPPLPVAGDMEFWVDREEDRGWLVHVVAPRSPPPPGPPMRLPKICPVPLPPRSACTAF